MGYACMDSQDISYIATCIAGYYIVIRSLHVAIGQAKLQLNRPCNVYQVLYKAK